MLDMTKVFSARKAIVFGALFGIVLAVTAGAAVTAVWPRTAYWMGWAICPKGTTLEHESRRFSYKPGQRGVERRFYCVAEASRGQTAPGQNVTFQAFGWMVVFWALPMIALAVLLLSWAFGAARRRFERAMRANATFQSTLRAGGDPRAALDQLQSALGVANVVTTPPTSPASPTAGAPCGPVSQRPPSFGAAPPSGSNPDPVDAKLARLEKIESLRRQGVIDQRQYDALKKEILGS